MSASIRHYLVWPIEHLTINQLSAHYILTLATLHLLLFFVEFDREIRADCFLCPAGFVHSKYSLPVYYKLRVMPLQS